MNRNLRSKIKQAANLRYADNPDFTITDFLSFYPQFGTESKPLVPVEIIQSFIDLANAYINIAYYKSVWKLAMCLFVAHFLILYLQTTQGFSGDDLQTAADVISNAQALGLVNSTSVGDVSESLDYSIIANDLDGWAAWKATIYGQQLATFAKMVGKGGMLIW